MDMIWREFYSEAETLGIYRVLGRCGKFVKVTIRKSAGKTEERTEFTLVGIFIIST